jgi:DNA-directed RNA polymerase specialized sigma24 family protein
MLTMRHRFGWTLRRIGNAVGLSPGAVDGRLGRTREALRKQASEQFNDQ